MHMQAEQSHIWTEWISNLLLLEPILFICAKVWPNNFTIFSNSTNHWVVKGVACVKYTWLVHKKCLGIAWAGSPRAFKYLPTYIIPYMNNEHALAQRLAWLGLLVKLVMSMKILGYILGIKKFWKLVKILLALIIFYKMNTDNHDLLKFWFHLVV